MANISSRKDKDGNIISYRIRVARGYDSYGKKLKPYELSWKPAPGMTSKQIEKELNKQAVEFEEQCKNGLSGTANQLKLAEFCTQYLEIKKNVLAPRTQLEYQRFIDSTIIPLLGHIKLKDIKPGHVQQFVQYLSGDVKRKRDKALDTENSKLSQSSIRRRLAVLQSILKQAVKLGYIPTNPANAEKLTLQKVVPPKVEIFSRQEAAVMLEALEQEELQFQVLVQLAIISGCRAGELCALKFSDFDYTMNKVTIERSAYKLPNEPISLKPPKDYELRTVTLSPHCIELVNLLKAEKEKEALRLGSAWKDGEWLFTQWDGDIMNPQTPTKQFTKFLKRHNFQHKKFHSLRHSSATLLLYGGVNIRQVQERLGHGSIATTNKYLHCLAEADEQAANILQDMLIRKVDTNKNAKTG